MKGMGKKTGKKEQVLLRFDDDPIFKKKFVAIRRDTGIESNADVVRMLVNEKYKEIMRQKKVVG